MSKGADMPDGLIGCLSFCQLPCKACLGDVVSFIENNGYLVLILWLPLYSNYDYRFLLFYYDRVMQGSLYVHFLLKNMA